MSQVFTQNLHIAGSCSVCGPTMVSRQGMPGRAPAAWHCDNCAECGPGIAPSVGSATLDFILAEIRQLDVFLANLWWDARMGRASSIGCVRWVAECFGD